MSLRSLWLAAHVGLLLTLPALVAAPALAQQRAAQRGDPEQRLANLTERLKLSEEQQGRILPILEDETRELRAAFDKARVEGKQGGFREAAMPIRARTDQRIEAELSEEQKTAFHALRAEQRERAAKALRQGPAGGPAGAGAAGGAGEAPSE